MHCGCEVQRGVLRTKVRGELERSRRRFRCRAVPEFESWAGPLFPSRLRRWLPRRTPSKRSSSRKGTPRACIMPLASPFTEALSTLNDRALRRLLGARAYLRGYDYVRHHAVEDIVVDEAGARGQVRGTDSEPYRVALQLTPAGFTSRCTCPAFVSSNGGHCKHVAALLIALRDQARGAQLRPAQGSSNGVHYTVHGGTVHVAGVEGEGRRSKRARARAMKAAQQAAQTARVFVPSAGSGVDAWLPEPMPPPPKNIEYRLQIKQVGHGPTGVGGALTIPTRAYRFFRALS
jgi:hypothetical protein